MVNTKKPLQSNAIQDSLQQSLVSQLKATLKPASKLVVGLSGGLDSVVLLDLLVALRAQLQLDLCAVHIHHGLSTNADDWGAFCKNLCARSSIPLYIERVQLDKASGLGIEATARMARYQVLHAALNLYQADYIVLAHHQNDQAETLFLQLLRGSGVKGLSAMASQDELKRILRPLLNIPRVDLETYATVHQLSWVEDESNANVQYDRNYCRHQILPVVTARFPSAIATIARTAQHMAEASQLLDELAAQDFALQADSAKQSLSIHVLSALSVQRARNLLRWWLVQQHQPLPSAARLHEMLQQLLSAKNDASIKVAIDSAKGIWLRRYQNMAYIQTKRSCESINLIWQGESELIMPDGSCLVFKQIQGAGLALKRLGLTKLRISHRVGGERFKPELKKPTRTLKHLLQEANIPPWQRECLPLIYAHDTLAIVPNIGVACDMQAGEGELGLHVEWLLSP